MIEPSAVAAARRSLEESGFLLLGEIDEWLRAGPVAPGMFWAESGLDVPFDTKSVAEFRKAVHHGRVSYEEFVMARSRAEDMAANMDWCGLWRLAAAITVCYIQ